MNDLQRLFAKDPLDLTDIDLDAMISDLRSRRSQFILGSKRAGSVKKDAKPLPKGFDLQDLLGDPIK